MSFIALDKIFPTILKIFPTYSKFSKISNAFLFLFSKKCWLSGLFVKKANREDPDQIAWSALFVYAF